MTPLRALLGLLFAANGLAMLLVPDTWFHQVPGVTATGPLNPHFVRDVGAAYLLTGVAFLALTRAPAARPYALAGIAFLLAHACIHLVEAALGLQSLAHLLGDLPAVFAVPLLGLFAAWRAPIRPE
ncbi:MAG: hypothetical protein K2Y51_16545 [Gammaproteobacteria bacterium]|jgi:hypothetical protein|nr:hypothetical protein [Gammaproteobacteria bacterium]